jgi:hypothetical protein
MSVILAISQEIEIWMSAPAEEALRLQRPLPDGERTIVGLDRKDEPQEAA